MLVTLFKMMLLPPALQILMVVISLLYWRWKPKTARCLMLLAWVSLLVLSLPIVSARLFVALEGPYLSPVAVEKASADAVVVLGGGRLRNTPEYQGDHVSHASLWRLHYAAYLAKKHQWPVIVSGGTVYPYEKESEAALGAKVLRNSYQIPQIFIEGNSRNTWQNAHKTAELLKILGFSQVVLVTHAYHMQRAEYSFRQAGVSVIPQATGFLSQGQAGWWNSWIPKAKALQDSKIALHEYIGLVYYRWFKS